MFVFCAAYSAEHKNQHESPASSAIVARTSDNDALLEAELQMVASDRWSNESDGQRVRTSSSDETLPAELDDLSRKVDVGGRPNVETTADGGLGDTGRASFHSPAAGSIQKRTVAASLGADRTSQRHRQRERGSKYGYVEANGVRVKQNRNRTASTSPSSARDRHRLRQLHGGRNKGKSSAYWSGSGSWPSRLSASENGRQSDAAYSGSSQSMSPAANRNPSFDGGSNEVMPQFGRISTEAAAAAAASSTLKLKEGENRNGSQRGADDAVVDNKVTVVDVGGGAGANGWAVGRGGGGGEREGMITSDVAMRPSTTTNEIDAIESTCDKMKCQRGGECVAAETTKTTAGVRCRCPLGTRGQHCEQGCLNCFYPSGASGLSNCLSICVAGRHFACRTKFSVLSVPLAFPARPSTCHHGSQSIKAVDEMSGFKFKVRRMQLSQTRRQFDDVLKIVVSEHNSLQCFKAGL
jgi:hypothetical protein